jgi:hypothetical protein
MRFLSLFVIAGAAWGQISVAPASISQSMRQGQRWPRESTVYPRRQFVTVSGNGAFTVKRGGPLGESACDRSPCFAVTPTSGVAPATILIDWDSFGAELLPAGQHRGTVAVTPGATIEITLEVMPRQPFAEPRYKPGYPSGCVNSSALYPYEDTCTIPNEKPPGVGFDVSSPGGCLVDPAFGSTVTRITPPGYTVLYSTVSACNSDCSLIMATDLEGWLHIFNRLDGTRVYPNLPVDPAMSAWDGLDPGVYWRRGDNNRIVKRDLAAGKDTVAADYGKVFTSISAGGTGDITNDNWWGFFAEKERKVCAVDLNDLTANNQPGKTYCASYGDIPLPPAFIDFVLVSEPDRLGKRYVVMLASPAAAIWSVNTSTGSLDFERHLEEPQRKQNNDNGICEKGEVCVMTPHSDLGRDEDGNVVLFMEWTEIYRNQIYLVTLQLNKGKDAFRPIEEGGGMRILYPTNTNGGMHFGCTTGVCVFSSWSGAPVPLLAISGATQAQPAEITTSADHPWNTGDRVLIEGARGNTCVNGIWTVAKVSGRKFFLDGSDCRSASGYSGGGQAATGNGTPKAPNHDELVVVRLSNPPAAFRLAHHRSVRFNDGQQGYYLTPRASISRDGAYVVYVSNMGGLGGPSVWAATTEITAPASVTDNCVGGVVMHGRGGVKSRKR